MGVRGPGGQRRCLRLRGRDAGRLGDFAWFADNAGGGPHPVGGKQPNAWGLHDMHGNVPEWTADGWGKYGAAAAVDPQGAPSGKFRTLRGGWHHHARSCLSA